MVYDENGQLLTGEFTADAMPKAHDILFIESLHTETSSPVNPLGVKGVGEAGAIGAPPAIVNSVGDALSQLCIRHLDMPLTPEMVWSAIQGAAHDSPGIRVLRPCTSKRLPEPRVQRRYPLALLPG